MILRPVRLASPWGSLFCWYCTAVGAWACSAPCWLPSVPASSCYKYCSGWMPRAILVARRQWMHRLPLPCDNMRITQDRFSYLRTRIAYNSLSKEFELALWVNTSLVATWSSNSGLFVILYCSLRTALIWYSILWSTYYCNWNGRTGTYCSTIRFVKY